MRSFLVSSVLACVSIVRSGTARAQAPEQTALVEQAPGELRGKSESRLVDSPFAPTISVKTDRGGTIASCLGVMVAPRVALTAGHCLSDSAKTTVHAATVGGTSKTVAVHRFWTDPTTDHRGGMVDMESSDIAILVLTEPLPMPAYARYAHGPLERAVRATGIRKAPNVIEAMGITLRPATSRRYYASTGFAKPGDSGSPVFVGEGDERVVVGVLAGGSTGREVFARVDLVAHKLDELVVTTAAPGQSVARPTPRTVAPRTSPKPAPPPPSPSVTSVTWT